MAHAAHAAHATHATHATQLRIVAIGATAMLAIVYFVALHLLIVDRTMPACTSMLIAAPWLLAAASAAAKAIAARRAARLAVTVMLFGLAMTLVARWGGLLHDRVDLLAYLENLVFVLWLAGLFATSLLGPREALVTRLARFARHGDMPADVVRYTRVVTIAWASFFVIAALVSTGLFTSASREVWSAFVNLVLWPSTALAFGIEYAIRVRVLPHIAHTSPLTGMRTFMQRDRCDAESAGQKHR